MAGELDLGDLGHGQMRFGGDLRHGRRPAPVGLQEVSRPLHVSQAVLGVDGEPDGAAAVGDTALDGLADPPGGVGGELEAFVPVELLHSVDEAEVAFLNEVEEQVLGLVAALPERYQAVAIVAAASGLRQGEVFGLTLPHLDVLRRELRVGQQMKHLAPAAPYLAAPKTPSSVRTVPLPDVALEAAGEHLRRWPAAKTMTAPGGGEELLVYTTSRPGPLTRATFNATSRKAVKAAGLKNGTGFHELRHYYASLLIASGASVKTVQARLGHKSAVETLDTYGHLWPDSEDQTRRAVDQTLGVLRGLPAA